MILAITSILLNALAQIFLKSLSSLSGLNWEILRAWQFYATGLCYATSIFTWFLALKLLPLNLAYPLQAGGYVIVSILAWFVFGEPLTVLGWISLAIIVIGVCLLAFSGAS